MNDLLTSSSLKQEQKDILFEVLGKYGSLSSYQLEMLSHAEVPWIEARKGINGLIHSSAVISKKVMKDYYSSLVNGKKQTK